MSQGANEAFSTKGKKCCVFPFLPNTERDEKRSFLPAGGKSHFFTVKDFSAHVTDCIENFEKTKRLCCVFEFKFVVEGRD